MAGPTTQSSGVLIPGTAQLYLGKTTLNAVIVQPGGTITIYDNNTGTAAGPVVFLYVNAGTSTNHLVFQNACRTDNGMTYVVSGANAIIYFGAA